MSLMPRRRKLPKQGELMLVPMIDIFSVMVTFLLMTAVFTRLSIIQLDLPSGAASASDDKPTFRLEVIVTKAGLKLTDSGKEELQTLPMENGEYPLQKLADITADLKVKHPEVDTASVLMANDVNYNALVQVMDAIRSTDQASAVKHGYTAGTVKDGRVDLFPKVAVGDAPGEMQ